MTNTVAQLPSLPALGLYNRCSGALSLVVPQESKNLIIAPSFELYTHADLAQLTCWKIVTNTGTSNADNWIVTGDHAWSGAASLYSRVVSAQTVQTIRYESLAVTAGRAYAWSFYVRGAPTAKNRLYTTSIKDASTGAVYTSRTFNVIESTWQRIELIWQNAAATSVVLTIDKSLESGSYAGGDCYIDACQFEQIQHYDSIVGGVYAVGASTYFDGDTSGFYNNTATLPEYAWQGFPHRSASVRSGISTHGGRIYNLQDECGFDVVAVNEANAPTPNNQVVNYNTADGSGLIDIVNPSRTITIVGRISGADASDFAQKLSKLTALFSRDVSAIRQPRRYIFQHKDGRDNVGVPMTFTALFESGINVQISSAFTADTEISLTMIDPYFYGHDESVDLSTKNLKTTSAATTPRVYYTPSNLGDLFDDATPTSNYLFQALGVAKSAVFNGSVNVMRVHPITGKIWMAGAFTQISGVTYNRIVVYDIVTKTFSAVMSGASNGLASTGSGAVYDMEIAPNGDVWVCGYLFYCASVAGTSCLTYYNGTTFVGLNGDFRFVATPTATVINSVAIRTAHDSVAASAGFYPYLVVVGGNFNAFYRTTPAATITTPYIAAMDRSTANSWIGVPVPAGSGGGVGVNDTVTSVVYNKVDDSFYFTGNFTTDGSTFVYQVQGAAKITVGDPGSTTSSYPYIKEYSRMYPAGTGTAATSLFVDPDGTLLLGRSGTSSELYVDSGFRSFPYTVTRPSQFRNGVQGVRSASTEQYSTLGIQYWGGTLLSGSVVVTIPFDSTNTINDVLELPDGSFFTAADPAATLFTNFQLVKTRNSSTSSAKPTFRLYNGSNANVSHHVNLTNQNMIIYQKRSDLAGIFRKYELVELDTKAVICQSSADGSKIWVINDASQLTTFTIQPGDAIMMTADLSQTLTTTAGVPADLSVCYWKQTFQSLFDGAARS